MTHLTNDPDRIIGTIPQHVVVPLPIKITWGSAFKIGVMVWLALTFLTLLLLVVGGAMIGAALDDATDEPTIGEEFSYEGD